MKTWKTVRLLVTTSWRTALMVIFGIPQVLIAQNQNGSYYAPNGYANTTPAVSYPNPYTWPTIGHAAATTYSAGFGVAAAYTGNEEMVPEAASETAVGAAETYDSYRKYQSYVYPSSPFKSTSSPIARASGYTFSPAASASTTSGGLNTYSSTGSSYQLPRSTYASAPSPAGGYQTTQTSYNSGYSTSTQNYRQPQPQYSAPVYSSAPQGYYRPQPQYSAPVYSSAPQSYYRPQPQYSAPVYSSAPQGYYRPQPQYSAPVYSSAPQGYYRPQPQYSAPVYSSAPQGYYRPQPQYSAPVYSSAPQGYYRPQPQYSAPVYSSAPQGYYRPQPQYSAPVYSSAPQGYYRPQPQYSAPVYSSAPQGYYRPQPQYFPQSEYRR
jgi:hypothetical protein